MKIELSVGAESLEELMKRPNTHKVIGVFGIFKELAMKLEEGGVPLDIVGSAAESVGQLCANVRHRTCDWDGKRLDHGVP